LRGVARAVDAAHASGIAHRDLKPDNVFLVRSEEGVQTKLLDFGIAKLLGNRSGQKTQTGTPIGTPHYMSPEQARGVNVGTRTDVYSFGVMTYQMLTGVLPFEGDVVMDILVKHMSETPPPPSSKNASLAHALDAPILHMLSKEPDARPPTLMAAVDELAAAWSSTGGAPEAATSAMSVSFAPSARVVSQRTFVGATTEIAPAPKKRGAGIYVGAAIAALAVVGGVFYATSNRTGGTSTAVSDHPTATMTVASVTASSMQAPPTVSVAQMTDVLLTIDSTPAHVEVWDGATKLGTAPGPFQLPHAGTRKLTFKLAGYAPRDSDVDLGASGTLSIALTPTAKTATTATAKPTSSHKTSSELETPTF
jgi:serine/threonine-protein kinase